MSEFEVFLRNESSDYGEGIMLQKYGDNYSLIVARESKQGTVYLDWCFPRDKDKKPKEKAIPIGVRLGNRTQAVKTLQRALEALGATVSENNEDCPF